MNSKLNPKPAQRLRLEGWKSIAGHCEVSLRTVQRWHSASGLPIHQEAGRNSGVIAFADELDDWIETQGRSSAPATAQSLGRVLPRARAARNGVHGSKQEVQQTTSSAAAREKSVELVALANTKWGAISKSNLNEISRLFREAIELDASNAEAFAGLSMALIGEGLLGTVRAPDAYVKAKAVLDRALELDPALPEAISAAAWLKLISTRA